MVLVCIVSWNYPSFRKKKSYYCGVGWGRWFIKGTHITVFLFFSLTVLSQAGCGKWSVHLQASSRTLYSLELETFKNISDFITPQHSASSVTGSLFKTSPYFHIQAPPWEAASLSSLLHLSLTLFILCFSHISSWVCLLLCSIFLRHFLICTLQDNYLWLLDSPDYVIKFLKVVVGVQVLSEESRTRWLQRAAGAPHQAHGVPSTCLPHHTWSHSRPGTVQSLSAWKDNHIGFLFLWCSPPFFE